jgi:hypothetical protein
MYDTEAMRSRETSSSKSWSVQTFIETMRCGGAAASVNGNSNMAAKPSSRLHARRSR